MKGVCLLALLGPLPLGSCSTLRSAADRADGGPDAARTDLDAAASVDSSKPSDARGSDEDGAIPGDGAADGASPGDAADGGSPSDGASPSDGEADGGSPGDAGDGGSQAPIQISAGMGNTTCALLANGRVYCWGQNNAGQVGNGDASGSNVDHAVLVASDVDGGVFDRVVQIGLGFDHACALKSNGDVYCWGRGESGDLGDYVGVHNVVSPHKVAAVSAYAAIAIGPFRSCGIDGVKRAFCWGSNYKSMLGHAPNTGGDSVCGGSSWCNAMPVQVQGLNQVASMSLGGYFGCAIDRAGVACWGEDQDGDTSTGSGELGDLGDAGSESALPLRLAIPNAAHVRAGHSFACAWPDPAGSATCWGNNGWGDFGRGDFTSPLGPTSFAPSVTPIVDMAGSGVGTLVAIESNGSVWASGYDGDGELAIGVLGQQQTCPFTGTSDCAYYAAQARDSTGNGTLKAQSVTAGLHHLCATGADNAVYCWGANDSGQLGNGAISNNPASLPVKVVGLP